MNPRWITVEGDLEPQIEAVLRNKNSAPITWAGATFQFLIKKVGANLITRDTSSGLTVVSTDSFSARVRYAWQTSDGLQAGVDIQGRFLVTLANGNKISFPKSTTIAVIVNKQLT